MMTRRFSFSIVGLLIERVTSWRFRIADKNIDLRILIESSGEPRTENRDTTLHLGGVADTNPTG
jgi:hypothetical protein